MKVTITSPVEHDGKAMAVDEVVDIAKALAEGWIELGVAEPAGKQPAKPEPAAEQAAKPEPSGDIA